MQIHIIGTALADDSGSSIGNRIGVYFVSGIGYMLCSTLMDWIIRLNKALNIMA